MNYSHKELRSENFPWHCANVYGTREDGTRLRVIRAKIAKSGPYKGQEVALSMGGVWGPFMAYDNGQ